MKNETIWLKASLLGTAAFFLAGLAAMVSPPEVSARSSRTAVTISAGAVTSGGYVGISAGRGPSAIKTTKYRHKARKAFHRSPPRKIVGHARHAKTVVVKPVRYYRPAVSASFVYHFGPGSYYSPAPAPAHRVVESNASIPAAGPGYRVSVTADLLNVRSDPDLNSPVVNRVGYGQVLEVEGTAPGWLYVYLPNGGTGWVMEQYTAASYDRPIG